MISKGYRNQMSTPNENVTKLDLVGVCEALHCNFISFNYEYDIQQYMQIYGFDVAKKDENVSYIEMVLALTDSFSSYDGINENATLNMSTEQLNGFYDRQKKLLKIAVNLGIMENNASSLQNKTISKNDLNVVAVNLAEKYATICPSVQQYNDDTWSTTLLPAKLITNGSELPKNHDRYPYIINTIPKEVYEYSFVGDGYSKFSEPILCYDGLYSVKLYFLDAADLHDEYIIMNDSSVPYSTMNMTNKDENHSELIFSIESDPKKFNISSLIAPLARRMYLDDYQASQIALNVISHSVLGLKKAISFAELEEYENLGLSKDNPIIYRLLLVRAGSFRRKRSFNLQKNSLRWKVYSSIPLPKFIWVCELYSYDSFKEGKAIGEIVIDATATEMDGVSSSIIINYPNRFAYRTPEESFDKFLDRYSSKQQPNDWELINPYIHFSEPSENYVCVKMM